MENVALNEAFLKYCLQKLNRPLLCLIDTPSMRKYVQHQGDFHKRRSFFRCHLSYLPLSVIYLVPPLTQMIPPLK
jgi:hypothetical protein